MATGTTTAFKTSNFVPNQKVKVITAFQDLGHIPKGTEIELAQYRGNKYWSGRGTVGGLSRNIIVNEDHVEAT